MNKFFTLTKVLLKNGGNPFGGRANQGRRYVSLAVLAFVLFIFVATYTGALAFAYDTLAKYRLLGVMLSSLTAAACAAMIVFGILYVISIYYFVDDTVALITMPLKPQHILASKFVIVTIYQYIWEVLILLPCVLAFGIHIGSAAYWFYAAVLLVMLPVIPTVICSVISIVLMAFGRFFRNKDRVKLITGILGIAFAIGINAFMQIFSRSATGETAQLIAGKSALIDRATILFPSSRLLSGTLLNSGSLSGLLYFLLFIAISVILFALFLMLGNSLYLSGVVGLSQSGSSGRKISAQEFRRMSVRKSGYLACAQREWKMLYRTPAYFLNCVLGGLVFPPFLTIIFLFSSKMADLPINAIVLSAGCLMVNFFCAFNFISPTAVSRDGKDLEVSRFIPVSYKTQVLAKLLPGLLISWFSLLVVCLIVFVMQKTSWYLILMVFILGFVSLAAFNIAGLLFDILMPKLGWDDETAAVKRNFNFGIELILMFVIEGMCIILMVLFNPGLTAGFLSLLCINLAICIGAYLLLITQGVRSFTGLKTDGSSGRAQKQKIS